MVEGEGQMGNRLSRRSTRIARRQAAVEAQADPSGEAEESDPDYRMGSEEEDDEEENTAGDYRIVDASDDEVEEEGRTVHQMFFHMTGLYGVRRGRQSNMDKRLQRYGRVLENPPPMVNELSQELERATAAETQSCSTCPAQLQEMAKNRAGSKVFNAAAMLWSRRANLSGSCRGWSSSQRCHATGLHFLPNKPLRLRDHMQSRAYIGQYSREGSLFIGAFQADKRVRIYDTENNWRLVKDVHARNLRWTITDTTLSADQSCLLYASINPVVHLVNVGVGGVNSEANVTEIHEALHFDEVEGGEEGYRGHFGIFSIQWSANSREIVAGTGDAKVLVFDAERGKTVSRIRAHSDDVNAVAYLDENPHVIVSGSDDHLIKVWDRRSTTRQSKACGVLVGHTQGVTHLDSKGDGRYILSNGKDQTAKVWDIRKMIGQAQYARLPEPDLPEFGWDYRWMAYPLRDIDVRHPNDCSIQTLRGHVVATTLIRAYWSPKHTTGQRMVYSASADGAVYIYDVVTSKLVDRLSYQKQETVNREILRDVSWHPYQQKLVTAGFDGALVEWGYSSESMSHHLENLPDTGYDNLEENW